MKINEKVVIVTPDDLGYVGTIHDIYDNGTLVIKYDPTAGIGVTMRQFKEVGVTNEKTR